MNYQSKQGPPPRKPLGPLIFPSAIAFVIDGCCVIVDGNDSLFTILKQ
jgi:hypothetical protein